MIEIPYRTLWLDLETTGLDPAVDKIVEIGLVVADGFLRPITATSFVINWEDAPITDDFVQKMHETSGLLDDIRTRGLSPAIAVLHALGYVDTFFPDGDTSIIIGGSGIDRFDIPFLAALAPRLVDRFHYRALDLSGLKFLMQNAAGLTSERYYDRRAQEGPFNEVLLKDWGPDVAHRGVADALDAMFVARTARDLLYQATH